MTVRVVLAHTTMTLGEIEGLSPGDLIRLDRSPDATVDILINGVHAAEGDVVVIDDMVAARISQLHVGNDHE